MSELHLSAREAYHRADTQSTKEMQSLDICLDLCLHRKEPPPPAVTPSQHLVSKGPSGAQPPFVAIDDVGEAFIHQHIERLSKGEQKVQAWRVRRGACFICGGLPVPVEVHSGHFSRLLGCKCLPHHHSTHVQVRVPYSCELDYFVRSFLMVGGLAPELRSIHK